MFLSRRGLVISALALFIVSSGGLTPYWYIGGTNGALALWYGGDSIWVYGSSPQGPFAFHASQVALSAWADSATVTSFPSRTTARFSYREAAIHDTLKLELTRLTADPTSAYQCTATVGRWSAAIMLSADSAQRFFTLLHGKPQVAATPSPSSDVTYFDFQVERQARPTPASPVPVYPEPLRVANIDGEVLAQFVVDTTGLVDPSTFKVLKTTNPWFTAALYQVLPLFRFDPAQVKGHKVRELVQQPYAFNLRR
jgi:hypothetical protein